MYLQKIHFSTTIPNISHKESNKSTHSAYTPAYTKVATPNHRPNDDIVSRGTESPNMAVPLYEHVCNMQIL
jgi:hypothetical protein